MTISIMWGLGSFAVLCCALFIFIYISSSDSERRSKFGVSILLSAIFGFAVGLIHYESKPVSDHVIEAFAAKSRCHAKLLGGRLDNGTFINRIAIRNIREQCEDIEEEKELLDAQRLALTNVGN